MKDITPAQQLLLAAQAEHAPPPAFAVKLLLADSDAPVAAVSVRGLWRRHHRRVNTSVQL